MTKSKIYLKAAEQIDQSLDDLHFSCVEIQNAAKFKGSLISCPIAMSYSEIWGFKTQFDFQCAIENCPHPPPTQHCPPFPQHDYREANELRVWLLCFAAAMAEEGDI